MKKCEKCQKDFEPKFEAAKLCYTCWSNTKEVAQQVFAPAEPAKEKTMHNTPNRDETMLRMGAIKDALAYLELECVTQQRKTITKEDMYSLAEQIKQWILQQKNGK